MNKLLSVAQFILAILLFSDYFETDDLGSFVIGCMYLFLARVDSLNEKMGG